MNPKILILLIAYNNMDEVQSFIDHVRSASHDGAVAFAVCDNSPVTELPLSARFADVPTVSRPDNPGYLDGAISALEAYRDQFDLPEWVIVSNADLDLRSGDIAEVLAGHYDPSTPLVLAPKITEGDECHDVNPHVSSPRSLTRLRINRALTATAHVALLYLVASSLRESSARRHPGERRNPGGSTGRVGEAMFSPHGAMMIFSRGFIESIGLPPGVPLLAEEHAIGHAAARNGIPVLFEPRVHVHHRGKSTTGPAVALRRARMLSRAFRFIDRLEHERPDA